MIIPSIDLQRGCAVQLIGGNELAINAGSPAPIAEKFSLAGEIAVIDLDAAMGEGSNTEIMQQLVREYDSRIGGGIRDLSTARKWLDAGAKRIILGTAARPEVLSELPRERLMAAVDVFNEEVVVKGWRERTGKNLFTAIQELKSFVGGFLVTFVEREGRLNGIDLKAVKKVVEAAAPIRVTVAGGVTTTAEVRAIDQLGADCQVGMALYSGKLPFPEAITAPLNSDRADGLWPVIVCDTYGTALGLAWANTVSMEAAVEKKRGVYWSRARGLWEKGLSSGNSQILKRIDLDCDRDALRFVVEQRGSGFCHTGSYSCFGDRAGVQQLFRTIEKRLKQDLPGSYTKRLFSEPDLLNEKIKEEAGELAVARTSEEVTWEAADLMYFTLVKLVSAGVELGEVEKELTRRSLKITRRSGNAKVLSSKASQGNF